MLHLKTRTLPIVVAFWAVLARPVGALAEDASPNGDEPEVVSSCFDLPLHRCLRPEAREAYLAGKTLFASQKYLEALQAFETAYRLQPDPRLIWNRASTLVELGDHVQAARELDGLVEADAVLPAHESLREKALKALQSLEAFVRTLQPAISPAGAAVYVDGAFVGRAPLQRPLRLDQTRPHVVVVRMAGYQEATFDLALSEPSPERIDLVATAVAPRPASLRRPGLPKVVLREAEPPMLDRPVDNAQPADSRRRTMTWVTVGALTALAIAAAVLLVSRPSDPSETDLGRATLF